MNLVTRRLSLVILLHSSLVSLSTAEPLAKGIQDNSFFVEEAYNQEPGVVQHILNVPVFFADGAKEITPSFTQEWPVFSQTHQFSYTIPYSFTDNENGPQISGSITGCKPHWKASGHPHLHRVFP